MLSRFRTVYQIWTNFQGCALLLSDQAQLIQITVNMHLTYLVHFLSLWVPTSLRDGVSESQFARVMSVEQYLLIQIIHHWFESAKHKIYVRPVSILFTTSGASLALYIVLIITPFIGMNKIIISFANCFKYLKWVSSLWI